MAKRNNRIRLDTTEVQGEGSFVVLTLPTLREVQSVLAKGGESLEAFQESSDVLSNHIKEWDWVDDDGNPLPLPKDEPGIANALTTQEFKLLINTLFGSDEARKN